MQLLSRHIAIVGASVIAVSAIALDMALAPLGPFLRADPTNPVQVATGLHFYDLACASCHGRNLEGQPNWQNRLPDGFLPAPPHDEFGHTWHHADQILFRITKFGAAAAAPAGYKTNMPGFGEMLTDEQIWATLAYIKSRWPESIQKRQAEITSRYTGR